MAAKTQPCGQHTTFEPQCETCRRLAELTEALRELVSRVDALEGEPLDYRLAMPLGKAFQAALAALAKAEGPIP